MLVYLSVWLWNPHSFSVDFVDNLSLSRQTADNEINSESCNWCQCVDYLVGFDATTSELLFGSECLPE